LLKGNHFELAWVFIQRMALAAEKLTLDITVLGLFQQAESNSGFIFWLTKQQFQEFWNLKKNVIARINLNAVGVPKH